jgi:phosphoglycolate phosphatase-like HAD superfamily hydrolase
MNDCPLYIFDLDGTLANLDHRLHFIRQSEDQAPSQAFIPDWEAFFAACGEDEPIMPMLDLLNDLGYVTLASVEVWSGRDETTREATTAWLDRYTGRYVDELKLRTHGDHRPDHELKEEWLKALSSDDRRRLVCVFEDHDAVVEMWRRNGVTCCQVAAGGF